MNFIVYKATALVTTLFVKPLHVCDRVNHGSHVLVRVHYTRVCVHSCVKLKTLTLKIVNEWILLHRHLKAHKNLQLRNYAQRKSEREL